MMEIVCPTTWRRYTDGRTLPSPGQKGRIRYVCNLGRSSCFRKAGWRPGSRALVVSRAANSEQTAKDDITSAATQSTAQTSDTKVRDEDRLKTDVSPRYRLFLEEWDKGFMDARPCPEGYELFPIKGKIPQDLCGTMFRNGPGKFRVGDEEIVHPYDGDGLVASIAFRNGRAFFRSRFVETRELAAEERQQDILFRGTFATQRKGGALRNAGDLWVKNVSNTNVVEFNGHVWTLFEAGQPYRLDPRSLETLKIEDFGGIVHPGLPFNLGHEVSNILMGKLTEAAQRSFGGPCGRAAADALSEDLLVGGGDAVTAHPHVDPETDSMVYFSYQMRPKIPERLGDAPANTDIKFFELSSLDAVGKETARYVVPGFAFVHDFAMTASYYVLFQNPVSVDNAPYLLGKSPAVSCVRWCPNRPSVIHLIPRPGASKSVTEAGPLSFNGPPGFVFHHANAYEEVSEEGTTQRIVIDSIHYDSLPMVGKQQESSRHIDPDAAFTSRLKRVEIDLQTSLVSVRQLFDGYLEMPRVAPHVFSKRHRYVFGYNSFFEDPQIAITKIDTSNGEVEVWKPGPNRFALEPVFVPRRHQCQPRSRSDDINGSQQRNHAISDGGGKPRKEDDGYLVAQLFNSRELRSEIVILDASCVDKGPIAILELRDPLPSGIHGSWTHSYYGPDRWSDDGRQPTPCRSAS